MEAEHFVRIADTEPTKTRPLQGLWKVLLLYTLFLLLYNLLALSCFQLESSIVSVFSCNRLLNVIACLCNYP